MKTLITLAGVSALALACASPTMCFAGNGAPEGGGGGGKAREPATPTPEEAAAAAAKDGADTQEAPADTAKVEGAKASDAVDVGDPIPGVAKLRHPGGATSCTHDGHEFAPDKKGIFHVPHSAVADLISHGFEVVG